MLNLVRGGDAFGDVDHSDEFYNDEEGDGGQQHFEVVDHIEDVEDDGQEDRDGQPNQDAELLGFAQGQ